MPFAPIVGINGHGKNIVFGWALLEDQKATTFSWLFTAFVQAMGGKHPDLIMTDQDAAMKKAIGEMFSTAVHRNCFWHVMRNARENLGSFLADKSEMQKQLEKLIYHSLTEQEFEEGWQEMLDKYEAHEHSYLKHMYDSRKMWVPVFFKHVFCPFIKSTGRSESTNSNFKDYVLRKDSIETFIRQYEIFQEEQEEIERKDRFESTILTPIYSTMQPIERHAGSIYTRGIYTKFQWELKYAGAFSVEEIEKEKKYNVKKLMAYQGQEFHRDSFLVDVDLENDKYECICAKYDRDGILCCHVLRLFIQLGKIKIPDRYIKSRWTRTWKEEELKKQKVVDLERKGDAASSNAVRFALMMGKCSEICDSMCKDPLKSNKFIEVLDKFQEEIDVEAACERQAKSASSTTAVFKDPPIANTKSVPKGSRLLRAAEKKAKAAKKEGTKKSGSTKKSASTKKSTNTKKSAKPNDGGKKKKIET